MLAATRPQSVQRVWPTRPALITATAGASVGSRQAKLKRPGGGSAGGSSKLQSKRSTGEAGTTARWG